MEWEEQALPVQKRGQPLREMCFLFAFVLLGQFFINHDSCAAPLRFGARPQSV